MHGIELEYTVSALKKIAERSQKLNVGARGLNQLALRATDSVEWRLSELYDKGIRRIVIGPKVIEKRGEPRQYKRYKNKKASEMQPIVERLRVSAMNPVDHQSDFKSDAVKGDITNTYGWPEAKIYQELNLVKDKYLDWDNTTGSARKWWEAFEKENSHRPALIFRLAEELRNRNATITEFFLAYVYSNTDNIMANLHFLDYTRLKKEEEKKKKAKLKAEQDDNKKQNRFRTGEKVAKGKAGEYVFDGYVDEGTILTTKDNGQKVNLEEGEKFPKSSSGKNCWWKLNTNNE